MNYKVSYEDPAFATDFARLVQDGGDPELVAMMAPLLRGVENGGSQAAMQEAERFLHQQSLLGRVRDEASLAPARAEALGLLARFGQRVDQEVMGKHAGARRRVARPARAGPGRRSVRAAGPPGRGRSGNGRASAVGRRIRGPRPRPFWEFGG